MKSMSAFLRLYRKRLWLATGFSMIVVLADFYLFGVHFGGWNEFWHGVCNCRMSATDTRALLTACLFICFYVGAGLGFPTGRGAFALNPESGSAPHGDTRFLLTRPVSRACLLVQPLAIVSCALALVTILPILLLTGWLWMVKAPALVHIKALLQLVPAASMLGPDASLWSVATAAHFWRYDAAAWSLGLCSYALMSSQRWLVLCQNVRLKVAGGLIMPLLLYAPIYLVRSSRLREIALLLPARGSSLESEPSILGISLHVAFAGLVLFGCWRLSQVVET
jgi:hypothetical protein